MATGSLALTCSQRPSRCALGVSTVKLRRSRCPTNQPAQPGRCTVSATVSCSPLASFPSGQSLPCRSRTGTRAPSAEWTSMATTHPAKPGRSTLANALSSAPSRGCGQARRAAPANTANTTPTETTVNTQKRAYPFSCPPTRQSTSCSTIMLQGSVTTAAVARGAPTAVRLNASAFAWFMPWDTEVKPQTKSVTVAAERGGELRSPPEAPSPR